MAKKIIEVKHHVFDYECMWNGLEDWYRQKSDQEMPGYFFFALSGLGNFTYRIDHSAKVKRQAVWGDGRPKLMYKFVSELVGFQYEFIEGREFAEALAIAKQEVDQGRPLVIGCVDMYHLPYYKTFYHHVHIPIHYLLFVGYDEEKECVYVLDCGIPEVQELSYQQLAVAWDVPKIGLSDKNSLCKVRFQEDLPSVIEIADQGFRRKAELMLSPQADFAGIPAMKRLAREFPQWERELTTEEYQESLKNIAMYTGTAPAMPNRLLGIPYPDSMKHRATRDELAGVLKELGETYDRSEWCQAAEAFLESGKQLEELTRQIIAYLLKEQEDMAGATVVLEKIAELEELAYRFMLAGCK